MRNKLSALALAAMMALPLAAHASSTQSGSGTCCIKNASCCEGAQACCKKDHQKEKAKKAKAEQSKKSEKKS